MQGEETPVKEDSSSSSSSSLTIGGVKGHIVETIQGPTLRLYKAFRWKMIPKCTGRYTCRDHAIVSHVTPNELLQKAGVVVTQQPLTFEREGRTDLILVLPLDETLQTGIITYVKKEEAEDNGETMVLRKHYVHTLNTPSGFQRKLHAIGIHNLSYPS